MSSVMVVEDERIIALDISDSLTAMGYQVTGTAATAAECVRSAATLRPDLVLMDIHLAGELDGIDAARELRERFDIPVVYLTAYADDETLDRAKATMPLGYLTKPFRKTELRSTIEIGLSRHQREQQQQELREPPVEADQFSSLATIAASVAHEINNPLSYILSNAYVARQELSRMEASLAGAEPSLDSASVRGCFSQTADLLLEVEDGVRHIGRIAADLGTLGRRESSLESQDIVAALEWALRVSHPTLKHLARVTKRFSPVPQVLGDGVQLRQIFLNLALNAAQAMRGKPFSENELFVSTELGSDGQVCVSLRDTGSGMTPETLSRIFDPYFTTKQRGKVSGLGLSVCRRAVRAMGGSISVRSEPGRGSTFVVKLRSAPARTEPPQLEATAARILLIDDDPAVLGGLRRMLSGLAYDVVPASSAADAVRELESGRHFDVILCDLSMPEMDGMALYECTRRIAPELSQKFVFVTGGGNTKSALRFLQGQEFLYKPVTRGELLCAIERRLRTVTSGAA